jgi:hypothetical protein
MMLRFVRLCWVVLLCLVAMPRSAHAGGLSTIGYMPDYYTAVTNLPVASYVNPGAIRGDGSLRWFVDGSLIYHHASFDRAKSDTPEPADAMGANTGKATMNNWLALALPSATMSYRNWSIGVGLYAPVGGNLSWDKNDKFKDNKKYVGAVDSTARWHDIQTAWTTLYVTSAVAYTVPKIRLSFGVSANAVYTDVQLTQAVTLAFNDSLDSEGRLYARVSGWTGSFGLGTQWEALRNKLWLGLSYQAPPGLWNPVSLHGSMKTSFSSGQNKNDITVDQNFADTIFAGVRVRPVPMFELRVSGYWERSSVVRGQCLSRGNKGCDLDHNGFAETNSGALANFVRQWHNDLGARVAGSVFLAQRYEVYGAVSWDGNAIPMRTLEPGLFDGNDLGFTIGGRAKLTSRLDLGLNYMYQFMISRDSTGKSQLANFALPNHLPNSGGKYEQWLGILNLNLMGHYDLGLGR